MDVLDQGTREEFKGLVHLGLFGLAVACGLYNVGAWMTDKKSYQAVNIVVYSLLMAYESVQIARHLEKVDNGH